MGKAPPPTGLFSFSALDRSCPVPLNFVSQGYFRASSGTPTTDKGSLHARGYGI